jgi:hypothetical protein
MTEGHIAYWELFPTIDHIVPVARGGQDSPDNWICCSMLTNSIKSNWTLEELGWELLPPGKPEKWDGMLGWFVSQVTRMPSVLVAPYFKRWPMPPYLPRHNNRFEKDAANSATPLKRSVGRDRENAWRCSPTLT